MNEQFDSNLTTIRSEIAQRAEEDNATMTEKAEEAHRRQLEKLLAGFELEKGQLRCGKEA